MKKKLNFLTGYAVVSSLVFGFLIFSSFNGKDKNESFDEITVKRVNLIGEDGSLRMVLSNEKRQHSGRMNGKDFPKRERPSGIIFFNTEGDECGGLIYKGNTKDGKSSSGMSFTMDQYKDDQVIQILNDEYFEKEGNYSIERGIQINEFPTGTSLESRNKKLEEFNKISNKEERETKINEFINKEGSRNRLFLGRTRGNSSGLFLAGPDGQLKMMIYVDEKGNPKIDTFDEKGNSKSFIN